MTTIPPSEEDEPEDKNLFFMCLIICVLLVVVLVYTLYSYVYRPQPTQSNDQPVTTNIPRQPPQKHHNVNAKGAPLIVIVLMVKDEAPVMASTLRSYVDSGFTSFLIYDTGSTDSTVNDTHRFFQTENITDYVILEDSWIDFAASRNRGLRLTEEYFPEASFILMIDAEWHIHNGHELLQYAEQMQHNTDPLLRSHQIQLKMGNSSWYLDRLIKLHQHVGFQGAVHEVIGSAKPTQAPSSLWFIVTRTNYGAKKSAKRWRERDIPTLLKEHAQNPRGTRTVFYLARTYFWLAAEGKAEKSPTYKEDYENAIRWFNVRLALGSGFVEELYITYYEMAQCYNDLGDWDMALLMYHKAMDQSPARVEPYVRVSEHYWDMYRNRSRQHEDVQLAYQYASAACVMHQPLPAAALFRVDWDYDYGRYNMLGIAAYYVQSYREGLDAVHQLLMQPRYAREAHLISNKEKYEVALGLRKSLSLSSSLHQLSDSSGWMSWSKDKFHALQRSCYQFFFE